MFAGCCVVVVAVGVVDVVVFVIVVVISVSVVDIVLFLHD